VKKFHWPLQRLLDVTRQREQARRAEMLGLSRRLAHLQQQLLVHRAAVRRLIAEMSAMAFAERVARHADVMRCSDAHERRIERLEARRAELAAEREEKGRLLRQVRKKRDTLERLRAEARQEHMREQLKAEQRQFDESAHVSKARQLIRARAANAVRE